MKKEDLIALGIAEDVADKVLALRGKEVTKLQTDLDTANSTVETFKSQLADANTQIESFKNMKPEELQKAADEWKAKAEKAEQDAAANLASLKFDHALDGALTTAKAKNPRAVKALLDMDVLKKAYDEKTGTIVNFDEHLKSIKSENDYLFEGDKPAPKIVTGGNNKQIQLDPFETGLLKGAKLTSNEEG
jgi:DNA repair exonuclease SbcCD ATPase subunit